jgi:biotin carboxyl carrier protein
MEFEFEIKGQPHKITLDKKEGKMYIESDDKKIEIDYQEISENCISLLIGKEHYTVYHARAQGKCYVSVQGEDYIIEPVKKARGKAAADLGDHAENIICAPMPGKVLKLMVKEGDKVRKKQSLVIVEAMKMEHEVRAPFDATVTKVNFSEGQMVDTESPIIELQKEEEQKL